MDEVVSLDIEITNAKGIHARPASLLARTASQYDSEVVIEANGQTVSAKDVLSLLSLAAGCGCRLKMTVSGPDAREAATELEELIKTGFDFD